MKGLLIILSCFFILTANSQGNDKFVLPCDSLLLEKSLLTAISQVGVKEKTGKNDGEVEKYLHSVGLKKGNPYCAAAQYWSFWVNRNIAKIPIPRTGLANAHFTFAQKTGIRASYIPQKHDLVIWRIGKTQFGHIERIISVGKSGWVKTIAFNVGGDNREGSGVQIKQRNLLNPLGKMQIRGLVGFKKI